MISIPLTVRDLQRKDILQVAINLGEKGLNFVNLSKLFPANIVSIIKKYQFHQPSRLNKRTGNSYVKRKAAAGVALNNFLNIYVKLGNIKSLPIKSIDPLIFFRALSFYENAHRDCEFLDANIAFNYLLSVINGEINLSFCTECYSSFFILVEDIRPKCPHCRMKAQLIRQNQKHTQNVA